MSMLAPTLQAFFTDRLLRQRHASPRTVAAYRDTFRLLLDFVRLRTGKAPSALGWDDLDVPTISAFLDHLETNRHNSPRTRNARLAAIRSLFRYASLRHPNTPLSSNASYPSRKSGLKRGLYRFSLRSRSRRSWTPPTLLAGKADVTGRSCSSLSRPDCACPRSSGLTAVMSTSAQQRTFAVRARAARSDASPLLSRPLLS